MRTRSIAGFAGALLLGACSLAPPYRPPPLDVPTAYKEDGPWRPAQPSDALARGPWWRCFGDATLDRLEGRLDAANPDLAAAAARYDEARAFAARAQAGLFPQVVAGASLSTNKQSADRPLRRAGSPNYFGANELDAQASYEIDLWGKIRNQASAGKAQAQASAADLASARLSLEAELASDYFSLRGLDADARLLSDTVQAYQKARDLTQRLFDGKLVGSMDMSRAEAQLRSAEAAAADVAGRRALLEHAVAVLAGEPPASLSLPPEPSIPAPPEIPTGVPSALLQRRPDIASAERTMKAANAQIGVARAAFYPSLSISALGGTQATTLNLLSAANSFWAVGPSVSLPLFEGGALKANESAAYARFRETSADYRSVVLKAFGEVEDNLALLHWLGEESAQEDAAVTASQHTLDVALTLYREGADSYLEVVTAQTPLLQAQQAVLDLRTRRVLASIALIRALGGGWTAADLPSATRAIELAPDLTG
jgi:NodT family efflux transporter outer membrane factor (OMF) lipoprotein